VVFEHLGLCQTFTSSFEGLNILCLDSVLHKESKYRQPESQNHEGKKLWNVFSKMGKFGFFQLFSVFWDFVHKKTSFKDRKGDIRNQRETTNQNMYKKSRKQNSLEFCITCILQNAIVNFIFAMESMCLFFTLHRAY